MRDRRKTIDSGSPSDADALTPSGAEEFDELTDAERSEAEWETDLLIALYGAWQARRPDSPTHNDPRLLEWLARDLRAPAHSDVDLSEDELAKFVLQVQTRAAALRSEVTCHDAAVPRELLTIPEVVTELVTDCPARHAAPDVDLAVAAGAGRDLWDAECEAVVPLPDELPRGRYLALRVAGDSMQPLLHTGDTVLVKLGHEVERDAIVVARVADGGYVVKRVGRVTRRTIELCSLNPAYAPIGIPQDRRAIVGRVVLRWCEHDPPA